MMKMKKKFTAALLTSVALSIGMNSVPAYAYSQQSEKPVYAVRNELNGSDMSISPRFSYTEDFYVAINFDGSNAECFVYIVGKSNATKITGTLKLQKKSSSGSYKTVKSWRMSELSGEMMFTDTYKVSSKGDYRLTFTGRVYSGSQYENISSHIDDTYS